MQYAVLYVHTKSKKVDITVKIVTDTENNNEIGLGAKKSLTINSICWLL